MFSGNDMLKIGIAGAGAMGRGIAQVAALSGMQVVLYDTEEKAVTAALSFIAGMISKSAAKGKIPADRAAKAVSLITKADTVKDFSSCHIVVEAIIENLDAKQRLIKTIEDIVTGDCIIATNTSSLSVTALAAVCRNPKRVAGFHFFNPVPLMKLVEVVRGLATAEQTVRTLVALAKRMDHTPVVTEDTPGFIVNHIGRAYGTESLALLSEGIAGPQEIDRILRETAGFKMGPFELFDLTGLDISHTATEAIYDQFYQDPRFRPSYITRTRLHAGFLGRKSGKGFYDYDQGKPVVREHTVTTNGAGLKEIMVWVDTDPAEAHVIITEYLRSRGIPIDTGSRPADHSLIVVVPFAEDATTTALNAGLDPARVIGVDTFMGFDRHRTIMTTPAAAKHIRQAGELVFGADGVPVDVINDSPGFIVGRVLAMIVNTGCNAAEKGVAAPADIDLAIKLGLGYPFGPLEWGDAIGAMKILDILNALYRFYGDPRYRPTPWLIRRAKLGISLTRDP